MRRFRRLNHLFASIAGFFWIPCPRCGQMFGGHEANPHATERMADGTIKVCCWKHQDDHPLVRLEPVHESFLSETP